MSLIQTVVQMVRERGSATADDLMPLLPAYTRAQVLQALQNAKHEGWLLCKQGRGLGPGKGKAPGTFSPIRGERRVPIRKRSRTQRHVRASAIPRVSPVFALGDWAANQAARRAA